MKLGFIGLGAMGQEMAMTLLKAGHDMVVYNRSASKADRLVTAGATRADSVAVASAQPIVFTMVSDDTALSNLVYSEGGLLQSLPSGGLHISMSTISVQFAEQLTKAHQELGQGLVCAPVMGRPDAAAAAKLRILAAGRDADIRAAEPLFDVMGQQTFVVGAEPYMAAVMKLANNFMLVSMVEAFAEAMGLVRQNGVQPEHFYDAVSAVWASPMLQNYGKMMLERKFEPGFKLGLALKDMRLALAAADRAGIPLPIADLTKQHLLLGTAAGLGEKDLSALIRAVEAVSGIQV